MRVILGDEAKKLGRAEKWELLSGFLKQHGRQALAYASLQDKMEYYIDEHGYIAFVSIRHPVFAPRGKRIVLADPIAAFTDYPKILRGFLDNHPHAAFVYISEECADALKALKFKVNCFGLDNILPIQTYNTQGNWKEYDLAKRARNEVKREQLRIEEVDINKVDKLGLEAISKRWLGHKILNDREIWVYARKPVYEPEPDVRKFVAWNRENEIVGYVFYDPIYSGGKVIGYCNNTTRTDEQRYGKLHAAINMIAMDQFRREGLEQLNIGIAPFYGLDKGKYNDDYMTKAFFELNWKYGNQMYNFKGLCSHKLKYHGELIPRYYASNSLMPSNDVYLAYLSADIASSYFDSMWRLCKGIFHEEFVVKRQKKAAEARPAEKNSVQEQPKETTGISS